jgi:hypothetical protein
MTSPDRSRRIVLLTEGHSEPAAGKTASTGAARAKKSAGGA